MYGNMNNWSNMYNPYMNMGMSPMGWRPTQPMISETDIQRRMYMPQVSADLRDRAIIWNEYKTPDQKLYYFNTKTSERTWNKPEVLQELDDAIDVIKEQKAKKALEEAKAQEKSLHEQQGEVTNKVGNTNNDDKKLDDSSKKSPHTATTTPSSLSQTTLSENATKSGTQSQQQNANKREGMRPVSTTAIPGTPWCIVWTDKNRVFYFNPSTKTSVWDRPAELRDREDVDKMVSNPPNIITSSNTDDTSRNSSTSDQSSSQAEKKIKLESNSVGSNSTKSADDLDGSQASVNGSGTPNASAAATSSPSSANKPAVAPQVVKKEVTSDIEKEAAKKRETIPLEERIETFRKMLDEREVNPSSTFQRELRKIVFDARYLLLTSNERREVFEKYCLEKGEEERKKRKERIKKATDDFKLLLNEANLSSRSNYDEFHERYSQDPRFKALERTKDREILFDDHLALLRRKEREERSHSKHRSSSHHRRSESSSTSASTTNNIYTNHSRSSNNSSSATTIAPTKGSSHSSSAPSAKSIAIENFKQLLRETKLIDKDTRKKIEESEHQHLIDILCTLQNDDRYQALESMCEERRKILLNYIEELANKSH